MRKILPLLLIGLTSCAIYRAKPLENLPQDSFKEVTSDFFVGYKKLTPEEEKRYLGKNFVSTCFDAIQLTFENSTENWYQFIEESVSLPTVDALTVYKKARFSPTGRFLGYSLVLPIAGTGLMGAFTHEFYSIGPLVFIGFVFYGTIFGVIDAECAVYANDRMKNDYMQKSPDCLTIHPKTTVRTLLFVEKKDFQEDFSFTLREEPSGELLQVNL
ncbi:MAG: hypothetical protein ChlgKO_07130 [Chlamydiales bacterium]